MAIQFRRGDYDDMDANALLEGEACITTQDDPNTADGRGFYIKNGTLKRVVTSDELVGDYTLLDTKTPSSVISVDLFTTSSDYDEYLIVLDTTSPSNLSSRLDIGGSSTPYVTLTNPQKTVLTIKRLTGTDALVTINNVSVILDIDNKLVSLSMSGVPISSGTIKIYAR